MDPIVFFTRNEFDALSAACRHKYSLIVLQLSASITPFDVALSEHALDVLSWIDPERLRQALWTETWDNAEEFARTLEAASLDPDLPIADRRRILERLAEAREIVRHKHDLAALPETDDPTSTSQEA